MNYYLKYLGYKDTKLSVLVGFLYLLIVVKTQKESNKETFYQSDNKDKPLSNYCVPIDKSGGCPKGTTLSTNTPYWCSPNTNNVDIKGQPVAATCVQYCPPKVCVAKGTNCKAPFVPSQDDPNKCCIPDKSTPGVCYCGPSAGSDFKAGGEKCPSCTTCGCQDQDSGGQAEEEEEACDKEIIKIKVCKKPTAAPTVAPTPPPAEENCCKQIKCPTPGQPTPAPTPVPTPNPDNNLFENKRQYVSDPYLKEDSRRLYERTNPYTNGTTQNNGYDDFNIN